MLEVYFGILICLANCPSKDFKIVGEKAYYSKASCEKEESLIAQALYVKSKIEYGYKCEKVVYQPPKMD